jgi:hydrogenase expression/formation protein HypD
MKYVDEFRDGPLMRRYAERIAALVRRPWTLMEICGGQTHSIVRHGIDRLLPEGVTLLHGPGCPVCVTPAEAIDAAIAIASRPGVILCSFGDMLRVPGTGSSLLAAKARGACVRAVYSPLDALAIARQQPGQEVVFLAIGFETTAPATAMAVAQAAQERLDNFSLLVAHVLVPPAMHAILSDTDNRVQAFLAAGHVCTIMGYRDYEPIARRHGVPIVVTGFEPVDLMQGLYLALRQLKEGRAEVENAYGRMVRRDGNPLAQELMQRIFTVQPQRWRGIGEIPESGLALNPEFAGFDARLKFGRALPGDQPRTGSRCVDGRVSGGDWVNEGGSASGDACVNGDGCVSGDILRGRLKPAECPAFGTRCTPEHPLGATMVSSEGACAAYFRYRRLREADAGRTDTVGA